MRNAHIGGVMLDINYLNILISRYTESTVLTYVTDEHGRIIASTNQERVNSIGKTANYILNIGHSATIDNPDNKDATFGTPILQKDKIIGMICVQSDAQTAASVGLSLKNAVESMLEFMEYKNSISLSRDSALSEIGRLMLQEVPDNEVLIPLMNRHELDPDLYRTVICISIADKKPNYFNINLNLGYQSSYEDVHTTIENRVRHCRSLNSQDLVFYQSSNTLLIIKTFLSMHNFSKTYRALDVICRELEKILGSFLSISYKITYGTIYKGVNRIYTSYQEALETLDVGKRSGASGNIFILDNLLFEKLCIDLQSQIISKQLEPAIQALTDKNGKLQEDLINNAEYYVDSCMRLSVSADRSGTHRNTVNIRLKKFCEITGLNPSEKFSDAFIVKMIATRIRISKDTGMEI
jgi:carbohydrate diacid regulator